MVISPHANFYDAAVLVIAAAAILAGRTRETAPLRVLAIWWLAFWSGPLFGELPASPLAVLMWLAFIAMVVSTFNPSQPVVGGSETDATATERRSIVNA